MAGWRRDTPEVGGETVKDILAWVAKHLLAIHTDVWYKAWIQIEEMRLLCPSAPA